MKIFQSKLFERSIKKLHKEQKIALDNEIKKILDNPNIENEKKGELKGVFFYKFKIMNQQYLLSYRIYQDNLELITFGSHENYYRDLKNYLKK